MRPFLLLLAVLLLAAASLPPQAAHAAQSYDGCTGFIDSLPATIGTQGSWCLRKDLSTAITSGRAIHVAANNVTIDCNDFKIGGLAAGSGSNTYGIHAIDRMNASIRNCNLRGFFVGIFLDGGTGHRIEDNRIDSSLHGGVWANGTNHAVRRNRVSGTGGHASGIDSYGIYASGEVTDNAVIDVSTSGTITAAAGIVLNGVGSVVAGNTVRNLHTSDADSFVMGIHARKSGARIERNDLAAASAAVSHGISTSIGTTVFCGGNTINGFKYPYTPACIDTGNSNAF